MLEANTGMLSPPPSHTSSWSSHHDVEVHTKDTDTGVIPSTEIDMFLDTESKVSSLGEVPLPKLVLLDFETTLENFLSLGAADGDVDGDLFVTTDTERPDGVSGFRCHGCLTGELFQHLGGPGQPVTGFTDRDVCKIAKFNASVNRTRDNKRTDHELLNPKLLHWVCRSGFLFSLHG